MSHRSRTLRFALVFAGLAAITGSARAADDDFDFAQALSQRGYQDLAEEQFREILNDPKKSAKEKAEGQYGLSLIKRYNAVVAALETSARRRKPMKEVLDLFSQADESLAQFIERNASHPRVLEAKLNRSKLITDRADYIDRAIENRWLPSDVTESDLKSQVAEGYDTAIELLKAVEDDARAKLEGKQPNTDEYSAAEDNLGVVWLFRIAALYGKGAALPDGDSAGVAALNQALSEISEFMWLFDGTVRGLWAFHYSALCNWRLDSPNDAMRDMRDAASYVQESDGVPAARSISLNSYAKLGEIAIDVSARHGEQHLSAAVNAFEQMPQRWPTYLEGAYGQRAALSYARVLSALDRGDEALEMVQEVLRKAKEKGTGVDRDAGNVLGDLLSSGNGGAAALDPALLNTIAMSKWKDEDYRGAVRAFQAVIRACTTKEQKDEFAWQAWDLIGRCYGLQDRWYEAYLAFDAIEQAWAADPGNPVLDEMTNETGWSRAAAIDQLAKRTADAGEKAKLAARRGELVKEFAEKHPNSPRNASADEQAADTIKREAEDLRRSGDFAAAIAKYNEAKAAFEKIDSGSKSIDKVEALLAELQRKLALCYKGAGDNAAAAAAYDQSIQLSEAWLAKKRPDVVDSTVRRNRVTGRAICLTNILSAGSQKADVLEGDAQKAAYEALLAALEKHEKAFIEVANRGQVLVDQWRIEALIGTGEIDKSDELVSKLIADTPDLANGPYLAALVAKAREAEADVWLDKGDKDKYQALMTRAARLREYAITKSGNTSPESLLSLGNTFRKAGEYAQAEGYLRQTMDAYAAAGADEKSRAVRLDLIGLLIDQGKYEDAITPLEVELVGDPGERDTVLARLAANDQIMTNELQDLLKVMSNNKRVLSTLSRAYLEARRSPEDLMRSLNLSAILLFAHPKDDKHDAEWVENLLRQTKAYFHYGALSGKPEAYRKVVNTVENLQVLDLIDPYNEQVKGSKREFEKLLSDAKSQL
jgi:tetratricopeptide (TPR) repeat protein